MKNEEFEMMESFPKENRENFDMIKSKSKKKKRHQCAPAPWLSGYVRYGNDRREAIKKDVANYLEVTKQIATEWRELPPEKKKPYLDAADADRARYVYEIREFKKKMNDLDYTGVYVGGKSAKKKKLQPQKVTEDSFRIENDSEKRLDVFEIPIFTEEFIEHNRNRQSDYIQIRKTINDYEEQNLILSQYIENIQNSIENIKNEIGYQQAENAYLNQTVDAIDVKLRNALAQSQQPDLIELSEIADNDEFVKRLDNIILMGKNEKLCKKLIEVVNGIDFLNDGDDDGDGDGDVSDTSSY